MYVLREGRWKIYRIWGFPFFIPSMCTMRSDIRIHLTILFFFLKKKKERRRNKTFTDTPPYYRSGGTAILDWKRSREGKHSLQGKGLLLSLFVHTSPFKGNIKFTVPTLSLSPAPQRLQILAHWSAKTSVFARSPCCYTTFTYETKFLCTGEKETASRCDCFHVKKVSTKVLFWTIKKPATLNFNTSRDSEGW